MTPSWPLAATPILIILVLMVGLRWPAARAGLAGLVAALALAVGVFGLGSRGLPQVGAPGAGTGTVEGAGAGTGTVAGAVTGAFAEALFTAGTILWILLPALSIHHLQIRTGAVGTLRASIARLSDDPRMLAVLVGWFFGLFVEGAAGFGTPVALGAPFLVAAGFRPVEALVCLLIGHSVGVSFGAVGTPVQTQAALTSFEALPLATWTAAYHALLGWVMLLFLWRTIRRAEATRGARGRAAGRIAVAAAGFLIPYFLIARFIGPELPTLGGALLGASVFVLVLRRSNEPALRRPDNLALRRSEDPASRRSDALGLRRSDAPPPRRSDSAAPLPIESAPTRGVRSVLGAAAPYLALIAMILVTRLIPSLRATLGSLRWEWSLFGAFEGSFLPVYHPGTMLFAGFLLGAAIQRAAPGAMARSAGAAAHQLVPVTVALVAMLGIARLMVHAGMITTLADAAAGLFGGAWPLAVPAVGVLGTFVTGSATASNILLTDFQQVTAGSLGLPVLPLLGAQCFGAAVGNIICPHNIIAGAAAVGLVGGEGEVLRRTLVPCLLYAALGGLLALLFVL